jgi:polyhydroxyalkanoate synthesis repressor PhaR
VSFISRGEMRMEEYIVKKYLNRKLYDTKEKKYVNLSEISRLIREGTDLKVIDNHSKEDITSLVLAQIIVEQEKTKKIMLPSLLSPLKLLGKGGESMLSLSKKMLLAGIGTLSLTKEKAEKIADDLIKRGEMNKSEGKEFVVDLLDRTEKEKDKLIEKIKPDIEKEIEKMNFASKDSVNNLEKKIDELGNKIEKISKKIQTK